jgi:hypothetical protein
MSNVDHPKHYNNHPSDVECIAVIGSPEFCCDIAVKYLWRREDKHEDPKEDFEKAHWYVRHALKLVNKRNLKLANARKTLEPKVNYDAEFWGQYFGDMGPLIRIALTYSPKDAAHSELSPTELDSLISPEDEFLADVLKIHPHILFRLKSASLDYDTWYGTEVLGALKFYAFEPDRRIAEAVWLLFSCHESRGVPLHALLTRALELLDELIMEVAV